MKHLSFLIPLFIIIGCSTPEIHIPSYSFGSDGNNTEAVNQVAPPATSEVADIEDTEDDSTINKPTSPTEQVPTLEKTTEKEVDTTKKETSPLAETENQVVEDTDTTEEPSLDTQSIEEAHKEKPKAVATVVKKSGGFFSLFGSKPKTKNEYYTGGKIRSKLVMDDDSGESGLLYKYDYDGKIRSTVHIKHGLKNGLETLFDPKGMVMKRTPYINGRKDGIVEVYYPDGKVLAQITYADNKRHGRASKYTHDGIVSEEVEYIHGKVLRTTANTSSDDIEIPVID